MGQANIAQKIQDGEEIDYSKVSKLKVNVASSILDLIGRTPMVELRTTMIENDLLAKIVMKLESFEPCNSIKDRTVKAIIEGFENNIFSDNKCCDFISSKVLKREATLDLIVLYLLSHQVEIQEYL
jgi:hypothetical protein